MFNYNTRAFKTIYIKTLTLDSDPCFQRLTVIKLASFRRGCVFQRRFLGR